MNQQDISEHNTSFRYIHSKQNEVLGHMLAEVINESCDQDDIDSASNDYGYKIETEIENQYKKLKDENSDINKLKEENIKLTKELKTLKNIKNINKTKVNTSLALKRKKLREKIEQNNKLIEKL